MHPIHVLHVIDSLAPGGAEKVLVGLVNISGEYSVLPSVCVTRDNLTLADQIRPQIPVFALHRKHALDFHGMKLFAQQIRKNAYDILHVHGYGSLRFVVGACKFHGLFIPIVLHMHSSQSPDLFTRFAGALGVSHVVATSTETTKWANTCFGLQHKKISLIGNAINQAIYESAVPLDLSEWFVTRPRWVGCIAANVLPVKDYATLFRALSISRHKTEIGVLIIGATSHAGYFEYCRDLLYDLKLTDRVIFVGSRTDVARFFKSSDFGLFSSLRETGPLALLEYMAAGIPFVSTRVGLVGERLSQTEWANMVSPKDHLGLALALDSLLELSTDEWEDRRELGRKFVQNEFNITENMGRFRKIYDLMTDGRLSR